MVNKRGRNKRKERGEKRGKCVEEEEEKITKEEGMRPDVRVNMKR